MKIRCRRDKFLPLFSLTASFAAARDVRPALQNVKMIAADANVLLTATDGDVGARVEIPTGDGFAVEDAGEVILPAKLLRKILAETTTEEILLESEGTTLVVTGENFRYQLTTCEATDFPPVAAFDAEAYCKIPTKVFGEMIRRTTFAIDSENSHYALGGVLMNFVGDRVSAVSTDGRRLAFQEGVAESVGEHESENKTIFPPRTLNLIERAFGDVDEARVAVKEGQALIQIGAFVVSSTLIDGRFPNWRAIFPDKSGRKKVDFIAGPLASAVRQAEIVASDKKPGVWLNFEPGKVVVAAAGEEIGESSVQIPISYDGENTSLRLDSKFLSDFLRCVAPEETVSFYFLADKPALFETADGYSYVIMPLT